MRAAYRLAVFNVLSHNRDDHAKQFSFLMDRAGEWKAAPAYDLVYSQGPGGEHSTTVMGEGREVGRAHLMRLADRASITAPSAARIIEEVAGAIEQGRTYAAAPGVGRTSTTRIGAALRTCLGRLAAP